MNESSGWAGASFRGERGSPQGPGAAFQAFWAVCNLAFARKLCRVKSCYCKVACGRPAPLARMLARRVATFPGSLPPWVLAFTGKRNPLLPLHAAPEKGLPSPRSGQAGDWFSGTVGASDWEVPTSHSWVGLLK